MQNRATKLCGLALLVYCAFGFNNPVIPNENVPDPGAILYEGEYYIATTSNAYSEASKFPIHKSKDLQNWEFVTYAIPSDHLPSWVGTQNSDFWAPEIHIVNGKFHLYFTARDQSTGILCIGVAVSDYVTGPYIDVGYPLIRQETVGSIDATILTTDDKTYLVWKDDGNGNRPQIPTWIWAAELSADGLQVVGDWNQLIRNDLSWENDLVEGPWFIRKDNYYYLFYSANGYCGDQYAVGVARSQNPLGPYEKKGDPIRKSDSRFAGPGHCSVVASPDDSNSYVMLYHAWIQGKMCGDNNRIMLADPVYWDVNGWPYMNSDRDSSIISTFLTQ